MESRSIFGFPLNRNSAESFIYSSFGSGAEEGPGGRRASGDESEGGVFNLEFNQTG